MSARHAIREGVAEARNLVANAWGETAGDSLEESYCAEARDKLDEVMANFNGYNTTNCGEHRMQWVCTRPEGHEGFHVAGFGNLAETPVYAWGWIDDEMVEYNLHPLDGEVRHRMLADALTAHADRA